MTVSEAVVDTIARLLGDVEALSGKLDAAEEETFRWRFRAQQAESRLLLDPKRGALERLRVASDRELGRTRRQRDQAQECAERLAVLVAPPEVLGDGTSERWERAARYAEEQRAAVSHTAGES